MVLVVLRKTCRFMLQEKTFCVVLQRVYNVVSFPNEALHDVVMQTSLQGQDRVE